MTKERMKRYGIRACLLALLAACLPSCGSDDDDYVYPDVQTTFVELHTDGDGVCQTLTTDEGRTWTIAQRDGLDGLTPDSTYRAVSMYVPQADGEVQLYSAQLAISPRPKEVEAVREVVADPVELTSIWRGGHYLNVVVKAMVKDQTHSYHFIHMGTLTDSVDGHRTLLLQLYHNRNKDVEAFTRTVYLSVPLSVYADSLQAGDSIRFSLCTYKEGLTSRSFAW
jgi:hypothetical protein